MSAKPIAKSGCSATTWRFCRTVAARTRKIAAPTSAAPLTIVSAPSSSPDGSSLRAG